MCTRAAPSAECTQQLSGNVFLERADLSREPRAMEEGDQERQVLISSDAPTSLYLAFVPYCARNVASGASADRRVSTESVAVNVFTCPNAAR